jgi:2-amino-4-hydroxy-6-hydroxymethyldihydropteridine diphosphokinase
MPPPRHLAYLSVGSNIDKERNIKRAVELLAEMVPVRAVSSVYETAPVGKPDQEPFLNAAVIVETDRPPEALKQDVLAVVEERLGRRRTADRNAPRTIDLDIVLYDDAVSQAGGGAIPDPELLVRPHLAVPLAEIAPDYVHPLTGQTLRAIAEQAVHGVGPAGRAVIAKRDDVILCPRRPP